MVFLGLVMPRKTRTRDKNGRFAEEQVLTVTKNTLERLYWKEGKSIKEISQELDKLSFAGVEYWIYKHNIPTRNWYEARFPNMPNHFEMNGDLAYVLGAVFGDGCISKPSYGFRIEFTSTSPLFTKNVREAMERLGLHTIPWSQKHERKKFGKKVCLHPKVCLHIRVHSRPFHKWLTSKSLEQIEALLSKNPLFEQAFIRGFYEAEGSFSAMLKRRPKSNKLRIHNTDLQLLSMVQRLLKNNGISVHLNGPYINPPPSRKPTYVLQTGRRNIISKFFNLIKPSIKLGKSHAVSQSS